MALKIKPRLLNASSCLLRIHKIRDLCGFLMFKFNKINNAPTYTTTKTATKLNAL